MEFLTSGGGFRQSPRDPQALQQQPSWVRGNKEAGGCWHARKSAQERSTGHSVMCLSPGLSHVEGAWLLLNSDVHEIQILSPENSRAPSSFVKEKVLPGSVVTAI